MQCQHLGEIRIDRVVEQEAPFMPVSTLLPDLPDDLIARNADWLLPRFVDPATGNAVMSFHSFVVRTPRQTILVDACVGNHKERPLRPGWHRQEFGWMDNLAALGLAPADIDIVMCTHMHADHVGWNTQLVDGRWVPTFPNAKYLFHSREFHHWERVVASGVEDEEGGPPNHGSWDDSVLPVVEAGQALVVDHDHEIDHGIVIEPAPGHTPGNVVLNVGSGDASALLLGDVLHTPVQLAMPSLSSKFCMDPKQSGATRTALVERLADGPALALTAHFPSPTAGRVVSHKDAFRLEDA